MFITPPKLITISRCCRCYR